MDEQKNNDELDTPADILFGVMEEWQYDETVPDDMTFDEWARKYRPDLIPLLDSIPRSGRPMPELRPTEERE